MLMPEAGDEVSYNKELDYNLVIDRASQTMALAEESNVVLYDVK